MVSATGALEWLPWPRIDGDPIFCRLLDTERGGFIDVMPDAPILSIRREYLPHTLIMQYTIETSQGRVCWRDFLAPSAPEYWRIIESAVSLHVIVRPTFRFGLLHPAMEPMAGGAFYRDPLSHRSLRVHLKGEGLMGNPWDGWQVGPGHTELGLWEGDRNPDSPLLGKTRERDTKRFWGMALPPREYRGRWAQWYDQSLLVLRGLTFPPTGGMVAAATTSLPEVVGGSRLWDYRFVWIRDGCFAAEALLLAGDVAACRRFLEFVASTLKASGKPYRAPLVAVDGTMAGPEKVIGWLRGYEGSRPVRAGNQAREQRQNDVEGEFLWLAFQYWRATGDSQWIRQYWWAIVQIVNWLVLHWHEPDAGIWEMRRSQDHFTHSQVLAWVGVSVGVELADQVMGQSDRASSWDRCRRRIDSEIWHNAYGSGLERFGQSPSNPVSDASLLLLPLYGYLDVWDPLFQRTLQQIERDLVQDDLVFRYRWDEMGDVRYPFTLAAFWRARVYLRMGKISAADRMIARQLEMATDLKLFGEHVDVLQGVPRGNFPQLFAHAGLVTTLMERQQVLSGKPLWQWPR